MRRRGYGSGALYEKNGVWYGRWHAASGARPHRRIGMTRKPGSRDGLTRSQAERELRRLMDAEELIRATDRAAPTLGELGEMLTSRLQTLGRKRSTIESVESHVRIHIAHGSATSASTRSTTAESRRSWRRSAARGSRPRPSAT